MVSKMLHRKSSKNLFRKEQSGFTESDKTRIINYWNDVLATETDPETIARVRQFRDRLQNARFKTFQDYETFLNKYNPQSLY